MQQKAMRGSCLCGAIEFEVAHAEKSAAHCHCRMCRKFHGAAFSTYGEAKTSDFRWVEGEDMLSRYTAENGTVRKFCKRCGSSLIFESGQCNRDLVEFALGALDTPSKVQPDAHIFVSYKADWWQIGDDLPWHSEGRPKK